MTKRVDDLDDDETIRDGKRVRVPMMCFDGLPDDVRAAVEATRRAMCDGHRPGFRIGDAAAIADADRAYAEGVAWKTNAWRSPQQTDAAVEAAAADAMPRRNVDPRTAARDAYMQRLENAWRGDA